MYSAKSFLLLNKSILLISKNFFASISLILRLISLSSFFIPFIDTICNIMFEKSIVDTAFLLRFLLNIFLSLKFIPGVSNSVILLSLIDILESIRCLVV